FLRDKPLFRPYFRPAPPNRSSFHTSNTDSCLPACNMECRLSGIDRHKRTIANGRFFSVYGCATFDTTKQRECKKVLSLYCSVLHLQNRFSYYPVPNGLLPNPKPFVSIFLPYPI